MNEQMPRILMVEDSASLAAVYQAYLQDDPYRVLTADSLGGARDALGSFQPDIVLTKTVGTTPGVCAATTEITVDPMTEVYYCYTVQNTGNITLTTQAVAR